MPLTWIRRALAFGITALLLSGCMTTKHMPVHSDAAQLELKNESVVIFSTRIHNASEARYQPKVISAVFVPEGATERSQWLSFTPDSPYAESDAGIKEYLLSANLAPGNYMLQEVLCQASAFPFTGSCQLPVNAPIRIQAAGQVLYLGHIDGTIRARKENEVRAGPVLPLIDQAATGMSGGTFDVSIADRFHTDLNRFRMAYPALRQASVYKAVLPAWVRPQEGQAAPQP